MEIERDTKTERDDDGDETIRRKIKKRERVRNDEFRFRIGH